MHLPLLFGSIKGLKRSWPSWKKGEKKVFDLVFFLSPLRANLYYQKLIPSKISKLEVFTHRRVVVAFFVNLCTWRKLQTLDLGDITFKGWCLSSTGFSQQPFLRPGLYKHTWDPFFFTSGLFFSQWNKLNFISLSVFTQIKSQTLLKWKCLLILWKKVGPSSIMYMCLPLNVLCFLVLDY